MNGMGLLPLLRHRRQNLHLMIFLNAFWKSLLK